MRSTKHALIALTLAAGAAGAQAYNYPAFQRPVVVEREYNFAAASASRAGTTLLFQWREGLSSGTQFTLDLGLASPEGAGADTRLIAGGAFAFQANRADASFPFDIALTGGVGFSAGNGNTVVRLPFGAALGHTFALEDGFTLTPIVHPRLSLDRCSSCGPGSRQKVNVDVDVGVDFAINTQLAIRVAALLGGSDYLGSTNAVGLSFAWTP